MMEMMSRRPSLPPVHRRRLLGGAAVVGAAVTVPLAARASVARTDSGRLPADEVPLDAPRSATRGSDTTWRTGPMATEDDAS